MGQAQRQEEYESDYAAAEARLEAALRALEARLADAGATRKVAEESRELVKKHEVLRDENQKLKHGLQDAGLKQAAVKGRATEMLKRLDATIGSLEKLAG